MRPSKLNTDNLLQLLYNCLIQYELAHKDCEKREDLG